jgi:streptogramin lyase
MKKSFSRIYGAVLPMMALAAELGGLSSLATEPDTTPPQALSAAALGGGAIVGVAFNEALDAPSATNAANYALSGGAVVSRAALRSDGQSVALSVSTLAFADGSLTINNVKDKAGNPLAPDTVVPVKVAAFDTVDLGSPGSNPLERGSTFTSRAGDYDMVAGGSDMSGNMDAGHFAYGTREGDFDVQVRVARLTKSSYYAKAGLMARESLAGGSRNVFVAVEPPDGWNGFYASMRTQTDGATAYWPGNSQSRPAAFPNCWLRLKRQGDTFIAYRGTNGVDWIEMTRTTQPLPPRLYVGLATSAQNNGAGQTTTAWYREYQATPAPLAQPLADLLIRKGTSDPPVYALDNVYQPAPSGEQSETRLTRSGTTAVFEVQLQNDGAEERSFLLKASENTQPGWRVVYRLGAADVTAQILSAAGLSLTGVAPTSPRTLFVEMTPKVLVTPETWKKTTIAVYLDGLSLTPRDAVEVVASAEPTYQPDLMARREMDASEVGVHVYNSTGAGQSRRLEVEAGAPALYLLRLANDGNLNSQFTLSGPAGGNGWTVGYYAARTALRFDGSNDSLEVGNLSITGDQTIEMWIYPESLAGRQNPINKSYGAEGTITLEPDGVLNYFYGTAGRDAAPYQGMSSTNKIGTWRWSHIAIVRSLSTTQKTLRWYINGELTAEATAQYAQAAASTLPMIFGRGYAGAFRGKLDEIRVWNIARSKAEIQQGMQQRLAGDEAGLAGYWRLDDLRGLAARDSSPGGHPGALVNGTAWDAALVYPEGSEDITALATGTGFTNIFLAPGAALEFAVKVTPDASVAGGAALEAFPTARAADQAGWLDVVRLLTTVSRPSATPVGAAYTSDADFEKGRMVGVENVTVADQLQLAPQVITLPFIWTPNSNESTVSKVDTRTGRELGRYRTGPAANGDPSRTTVDLFGNCWVGNRAIGTVIKIGLLENGQFFDRNQNGVADTSRDLNNDGDITGDEILPWGQDECVLWEVMILPGREGTFIPGTCTNAYGQAGETPAPRAIAVDAQGNVWAGNYTAKKYYYIDGMTGQILRRVDVASVNHTPYGAVVDRQGILWSAALNKNHVLRLDPKDNNFAVINIGHQVYGMGLDQHNHLFIAGWTSVKLSRLNVLSGEKEWTVNGVSESRGVAVTEDGDVWTANSGPGTVTRWSNDGLIRTHIPVGSTPTGVSVDAAGKVWVVNYGDEYIHRINPATDSIDLSKRLVNTRHYGYSDMTGIIARNATVRHGLWAVIHDGQIPHTVWGLVKWNGAVPEGASMSVRVRSSADRLNWSPWESAVNGAVLAATPPGRFLEIEATLQAGASEATPVLYDVSVAASAPGEPDLAVGLAAEPLPPVSEHPMAYVLTVTNRSDQWASGIVVTNQLPAELELLSVNVPGGSFQVAGQTVVFRWAGLHGHAAVTAAVTGIPAVPGDHLNSAVVVANEIDAAPANNQTTLVTTVISVPCTPPPAGLVGWWPGDGHAQDLIGGNHATLQKGATFAPRKAGQSFRLDGADDYMEIPDAPALHTDRELTVCGWFRVDAFPRDYQAVFFKGNTPDGLQNYENREFALFVHRTGYLHFASTPVNRIGVGQLTFNSGNIISAGRWYHFAAVLSSERSFMRVYINGELQAEAAYDYSGIRDTAGPLLFGNSVAGTHAFQGALDELSLFNVALAPEQIKTLYDARSAGMCRDSLIISAPVALPDGVVGKAYSQAIIASLGAPPYAFTLADGALPGGLALSGEGLLSGVPAKDGLYQFGVRATDAQGQTAQRPFALNIDVCLPWLDGLVGWWPGNGTPDDFVSVNHGTLANGARFAPGKAREAFQFDGADDRVLIPEAANINVSQFAKWTMMAWIKPASFSSQSWPTIYSDGRWRASLGLNTGTGKLESWLNGKEQFIGANPVLLHQWSHVALVYDGSNRVFYINGVKDAVGPAPAVGAETTGAAIGDVAGSPNSSRFNGLIDEVMLFNRALDGTEIGALVQAAGASLCVPPTADLLVKAEAEPQAAYALADVYQEAPAGGQIKALPTLPLAPAVADVRLENDSPTVRSFVLRAAESAEPFWTVAYQSGNAIITPQMYQPTGFAVSNLPPGGVHVIQVITTPGRRVPGATAKTVSLNALLDPGAATVRDAVRIVTTCVPTHQPDLTARREGDVGYVGDDIYNTDGAGQSRVVEVEAGTVAVFLVQVSNDGNVPNAFQVKASEGECQSAWLIRYFDALVGGTDITAQMTDTGYPVSLEPVGVKNLRVEVIPKTRLPAGSSLDLYITGASVEDPSKSDTVRLTTTVIGGAGYPQRGWFTLTADFDKGVLAGVEARTTPDQLQLTRESVTLPFIWAPNSNESTVSKVDTRTGRELGRYRTGPTSTGDPSRTTVDLFGNCWVGNRASGTVVQIGLYEAGQYVDRNGDGIVQTSRDTNGDGDITGSEMLPWGQDECVLWEVMILPGREGAFIPGTCTNAYARSGEAPAPRAIAVDARGNVWAGNYTAKKYYYIDGLTGQILRTNNVASLNHTPYGAVVDGQGIMWSSGIDKNHILRLDPKDDSFSVISIGHTVYGMGLDRAGHLFLSGWQSSKLSRVSVLSGTKDWTVNGIYESRGVAVTDDGDVWTANSSPGTVTRWSNEGVIKATIAVGATPTGVSVDAAGKVWVVNYGDEYIKRIDPATDKIDLEKRLLGTRHYGYSDMTGIIARNTTTRIGLWTATHNSGMDNTAWHSVAWNSREPEGATLRVKVRSSHDQQTWSLWEEAVNGVALQNTPRGKYAQVQVTFQLQAGDASPVLYDLTLNPLFDVLPTHPADISPVNNSVSMSEATTYAAAWKKGRLWSVAPIIIPINYVTRAGALWAGGEVYAFDPKVSAAPLWWVNSTGGSGKQGLQRVAGVAPAGVGNATRALPAMYVPNLPFTVTIEVAETAAATAFAVEEAPPAGWTVSAISQEGEFDPVNRRVKWGPFYDRSPRTLTYLVTPPESAQGSAVFVGVASWNGVDTAVGGDRDTAASSTITTSTAVSTLPPSYTAGVPLSVSIAVTPAVDVSAYAVEDQPPAGWQVAGVSEGGVWDAVNQKVKWGPFLDHAPRTASYLVTPPGTASGAASFVGSASFDQVVVPVTGQRQTIAGQITQPAFVDVAVRPDGVVGLVLKGTIGVTCQVEASVDLLAWTPLQTVTLGPDGTAPCTDSNAKQFRKRFYRAKALP